MGIFRKTILYFLSDKNNQTYSIEGTAVVKTDKPKPLEDNPIGADGLQIAFGTNNKYWSLNRSFTVPLTFVNEGADILRYLVYKGKGYEEEVTLTILKLNPETGIYELEFQGKIDFTKLKDDPTTGVTVNVIEGGLLSYLNANDGIDYEIQCNATNPECVIVQFDGVLLNDAYKYQIYDDPYTTTVIAATYFQNGLHRVETPYLIVPLVYLSNEGDSVGVGSGEQQPETFKDTSYFDTSANTILENFASTPINIHLKGTYPFSISDDNRSTNEEGLFEAIVFIKPDNLPVQQIPITSFNIFWNRSYEVDIDKTISMPGNSKLFLVFKFPTGYQNVTTFNLDNTRLLSFQVTFGTKQNIFIYLETKNTPSTSYALQPLQLGRELVRLMTDGRYTMESEFFTTHNNIVAAGGEAIRGLANAVLKTSFQDFFNSYNTLFNLGVKVVDSILWIEPKKDLYNDSAEILDLGEVSDFAIGYAEEYLVNSVQIGYPVQDYDQRNGRYEFNDTVQWKLPVNAVNKPLDLVSKYRGDSYGIEFNRGKLNNKDSTDNKGDNEVFLININTYGAAGEVSLTAIKNAVNNYSGLITFDSETVTGGAENFIGTVVYEYVYHYASPQQVEFNFIASGTRLTDTATFTIYLNGAAAASHTVDTLQVFNVSLSIGPTLKNGDIVHIGIDNPVNLTSAGLQIKVLNAIPLSTFLLRRLTYDTPTGAPSGVPTNSVYNVEEMTPKRMLLAHGNYLRGLLFQLPAEKITFQTADKNKDLSTTLNGVTITEKADVTVSELADPLFLPFELTFTTRVVYRFPKTMSRLNSGNIKFTYNNFPIYALPIGDMKCKPATDEAQEWKLLASPLNSLDTLLRLSQGAVIIQDYMENQIIISDLNPVHFVKYDYQKPAKYHFKGIYDTRFDERIERYDSKAVYYQKWQQTDIINLQFLTVGYGGLELQIFDGNKHQIAVITSTILPDTSLQAPYIKQQFSINLSTYADGIYHFVIAVNGKYIAISEWQNLVSDLPDTYLIEYYNTVNKPDAYFKEWRPAIRIEGFMPPPTPESTSTTYEDEPGDTEILNGTGWMKQKVILGDGYGLPDYMAKKLNKLFLLNRVFIEGVEYTKAGDAKLETVELVQGYPMNYFTVEMRESINQGGLVVSDLDLGNEFISTLTLDASAFGGGDGVIQIDTN